MLLYKDFTQKLQQYLQEHNTMISGIVEIPTGNREFLKESPKAPDTKTKSKSSFALSPVRYTEV